jgi:type IV secretion system T-DNA border endonuclease VirD2
LLAERAEEAPIAGDAVVDDEIRRVITHERDGNLTSPFENAEIRQSYRDAVERELDEDQLDRLKAGDADVLKDQIEDRLDRLYVAKSYLQSDAATANSEAARAVVEEIADREYELHRADTIDSETDRGPTHG